MQNYIQSDSRWGSHAYAGENMAVAGCGPTAVADIVEVIPPTVADYISSIGKASNGYGTYWDGIPLACNHFGYSCTQLNANSVYGSNAYANQWLEAMKTGQYYGILCMGNGFFANAGHFIAVQSVDANNNVTVFDVAYSLRSGTFNWFATVPAGQPGACNTGCPYFSGRVKIYYLIKKKTTSTANSDDIFVDGNWGVNTTKKAQRVFGTQVDGIISNQNKDMRPWLQNCQPASWEFVPSNQLKNGSALVKAIQKKLGITADGFFGNQTIVALQKFLGVKVDGLLGPATVMAFQSWLNKQ